MLRSRTFVGNGDSISTEDRGLRQDQSMGRKLLRKKRRYKVGWCRKRFSFRQPLWIQFILGCICFILAVQVGFLSAFFWVFSEPGSQALRTSGPHTVASTLNGQLQNGAPIDDYFSRSHIQTSVPLILGGSDGSGTRLFVKVLEQLAVPMLVEDRGTMDVHGREIFNGGGWPPLVSRVLNFTHSADYSLESLPSDLRDVATQQVGYFVKAMERAGNDQVASAVGKRWATGVSWGFKAPVSILLLPFFRAQLPSLKVLHIVRDGRDVALSDNHSPVNKFYTTYYQDASIRHQALVDQKDTYGKDARIQIKAMQLWNDWNRQVFDYGRRYSDGETLDVLVMRTEDLVKNPLESLLLLADFVGSPMTHEEICCLSRTIGEDLGKSGGNPLADIAEAGDSADGDRSHARFIDPTDFAQIRRRFANLQGTSNGENEKEEKVGQRRLSEREDGKQSIEPEDDDQSVSLFQSGGKLASAHGLRKANNAQQSANHPMIQPGVREISIMHQLLEEQRKKEMNIPENLESSEQVKQRYGKWMKVLEVDPFLSERLHSDGKESLRIFGYHPPRRFADHYPKAEFLECPQTLTCSN